MSLHTLSHLKLFKVTGKDNRTFLQGQLTNDINALNQTWHFSAYCSPKGRALANFIVWTSAQEDIYLLCEESLSDAILKRLRMYVMRSDVVFDEIDASIFGTFDLSDLQLLTIDDGNKFENYSYRLNNEHHILGFGQRAMLISPETNSKKALDDNDNGNHRWLSQDIAEGLPRVTLETQELFVPQMLNLDILDGISFKKGCYTGQEIVARMHYLGKLKQRSFVCEVTHNDHVTIGEKIIDQNGKNVGNIANAVNGNNTVVASLRFDNLENGLILESGATLSVKSAQPYPIETTKS